MQSLKNGTQLGGYTLIRLIARGGMGEVYEAHENKLQRRVALKVIAPTNPDEHDRDDLIHRFMIEARTLARVNHPNIVTIYSIDSNGGTPFIAMEFVDGVSFRQLLEEFTFTVDGAIPLFEQMLEGLKSLHENKIIHRDLKPHNLLLRPDGQVKILDFGIAKSAGTMDYTRVGVIVGTLPYMAPELKAGSNATTRSDIWSMGAIFFECLTGHRMVDSLKSGSVLYPEEVAGKIPNEMRQIIEKMCAQEPELRYANISEIIQDLRNLRLSRPPVSDAVWATLAQKVGELAEAERAERERQTPSVRVPQNDLHSPLEQTSASPNSSNRRRKKRNEDRSRWVLPGAGALAFLAIVGLFISQPKNKSVLRSTPPLTQAETQPPANPQESPSVQTEVPVILNEPSDKQILWLEPTRIPTFSWSKVLSHNEYDIQIALDSKFQRVLVQEPVVGTSFRPGHVLSENVYYWRLWPHHPNESPTSANSFTIGLLGPVNLLSPDNGTVLNAGSKSRNIVDFSWSCKSAAKLYVVQIDTHADFSGHPQERLVSSCEWSNSNLSPGTYFWRVRMSDVTPTSDLWSATRQFTIRLPASPFKTAESRPAIRKTEDLPSPKLIESNQSFTLAFSRMPRSLASIGQSVNAVPVLRWHPVKNAHHYLVEISASKDFENHFPEKKTSAPRYEWKEVLPGQAYWRVYAVDSVGEKSNASEAGRLNILLPAPKLNNFYRIKLDSTSSAAVPWKPVPFAHQYMVQIGPRRDLAGAESKLTQDTKMPLTSKPGTYYMRVAVADESGETRSGFSDTATLEIKEEPAALEKPKPLTPLNHAHAPSRNGGISIVFTWAAVPRATSYVLEIAYDESFKEVVDRRPSRTRGVLLQRASLSGRVYWRVQAKSPQGDSNWSEIRYFDVNK